jgi:hypothetical protein
MLFIPVSSPAYRFYVMYCRSRDGDTALVMQLLVKELTIEAILAYQLLMCRE